MVVENNSIVQARFCFVLWRPNTYFDDEDNFQ